jgi:hypothetical protein
MCLKGRISSYKTTLKVNNIPDIRKMRMIWEIPHFSTFGIDHYIKYEEIVYTQ